MTSLKRTSSEVEALGSDGSINKKRKGSKPLDSWLNVGLPKKPSPYGVSKPLYDKDSIFVGYAAQAESTHDIQRLRDYVTDVANADTRPEPASHVTHGARLLSLKTGKSGMDQSHFEVSLHMENDGEDRAGRTIVDSLAGAGACDVVVCVSRWFGGTMLGPRRFTDISSVTLEALYALRDSEEALELQRRIKEKDDMIRKLLKRLHELAGTVPPTPPPNEDYQDIELSKGKRLILARNARIKNLEQKIQKLQEECEDEDLPELPSFAGNYEET